MASKFRRFGNIKLDYDGQTSDFTLGQGLTGGTSAFTASIVKIEDSGATGTLTLENLTGTPEDNEQITDDLGGQANVDGTATFDEYTWADGVVQPVPPVDLDYVNRFASVNNAFEHGQIVNASAVKKDKLKPIRFLCVDLDMVQELRRFHADGAFWFYPRLNGDLRFPVAWTENVFRAARQPGGSYVVDATLFEIDYFAPEVITHPPDSTDLKLTQAVDNDTPVELANVIFTITANNQGPINATNVDITVSHETGLTYQSHVASQGTYSNTTKIWDLGALNTSDTDTLAITYQVDASTTGDVLWNAGTISDFDQNERYLPDNSVWTNVTVSGADLRVTGSVDDPTPEENQLITYYFQIFNDGNLATTTTSWTIPLPSGVTYSSDVVTQGSYVSGTGVWTIGALGLGAGALLALRATVNNATSGSSILLSTNSASSNLSDPNTSNNAVDVRIDVDGIDLGVTIGANDLTPLVGQTVRFRTIIKNHAQSATATGVTLTVATPTGMTYNTHSHSQGSYVFGTGVWTVGSINAGDTATLWLFASVNAGQEGNNITLTTGNVSANQTDDNASNDSDSVTITVET